MKNNNLTDLLASSRQSTLFIDFKGRNLTPAELKSIIWKSESEIKKLPLVEQKFYWRIRHLVTMCGGWSESSFKQTDKREYSLREHDIV